MDERPVVVGLLALGGAVGATLRYAVGLAVGGLAGTLVANVLGSFALGVVVAAGDRVSTRTRLALGGGLLSSFTTYSTFAVETLTAPLPVAVVYVAGSLLLGLGAAGLAATPFETGLADDAGDGDREPAASANPPPGGDRP